MSEMNPEINYIKPQYQTTPEPFVGIKEAAEFLGRSTHFLYEWKQNRIPCYKVGRKLSFRLSELEVWMNSKKQTEHKADYGIREALDEILTREKLQKQSGKSNNNSSKYKEKRYRFPFKFREEQAKARGR